MTDKKKHSRLLVLILLLSGILLAAVPFFLRKDAEFGGSDDAAGQMVSEVSGTEYEPWFTPVLEQLTGRELPGEVESLIFCIQTGIGTGILAFCFGYLVARKKYRREEDA